MTDRIEDLITEQLQGKADYDTTHLLRLARNEIQTLRQKVTDLGWAVDYHSDRAASLESQVAW